MPASLRARAALSLGLLTLALAWLGPLRALVPGAFSAHMSMHMAVVAVAAPLVALALAGGRHDPVCRAPRLFPPILASMVELLVVWVWHTPALHLFARSSAVALVIEQASFFLSALWLWMAAFGGSPAQRRERSGAGIVALLLTSMHMTLLGALLALPPRPLFAHAHHGHAAHEPGRALAALDDQHLGGAIMLLFGAAAYLLGGLGLSLALLAARRAPEDA